MKGMAVVVRKTVRQHGGTLAPKTCWALLGAILIPAGILTAASSVRVERTLDTTPNPHIAVLNLIGHVTVKGWDRPQVHLTSVTGSPRVEVDFEQTPPVGPAGTLRFTTNIVDQQISGVEKNADYTLEIPVAATLEVRNPEGAVQIEGIRGATSVYAVGGAIGITGASGHLSVRSVGGNIDIVRASGRVEANSVCGTLHFVEPNTDSLEGVTYSGEIVYDGVFRPGGEYKLRNFSGDVEVVTPSPRCSFVLTAKTTHGKVNKDLGPYGGCESGPNLGIGFISTRSNKATVDLTSFSGTIRLRHQRP